MFAKHEGQHLVVVGLCVLSCACARDVTDQQPEPPAGEGPARLQVREPILPGAQLSRGQTVSVTVPVRNEGGREATEVIVDLRVQTTDGDAAQGVLAVAEQSGATIAGNEVVDIALQATVVEGAPSGSFQLVATARGLDRGVEVQSAIDSPASAAFSIQAPGELIVDGAVNVTPAAASRGQQGVRIELPLRNVGEAAVTVASITPRHVPADEGSTFVVDEAGLADPITDTRVITLTWNLGNSALAGEHGLTLELAYHDVDDAARMRTLTANGSLRVETEPALRVEELRIEPAAVVAGGEALLTVGVLNNGGAVAVGTATVALSPPEAVRLLGEDAPLEIPGNGGRQSLSWRLQIDAGAAAGSRSAELVLDASDRNTDLPVIPIGLLTTSFRVDDPGVLTLPAPVSAGAVSAGQSGAVVSAELRNDGGGSIDLAAATLRVDPADGVTVTRAGSLAATLGPGESTTVEWTLDVDAGVEAGERTLSVDVDASQSLGAAPEPADLSASSAPGSLVLVSPAQLAVAGAGLSVTPSAVNVGQTEIELTLPITNTGGATALLGAATATLVGAPIGTANFELSTLPERIEAGASSFVRHELSLTRAIPVGDYTLRVEVPFSDANTGLAAGTLAAETALPVQQRGRLNVGTVTLSSPNLVPGEADPIVVSIPLSAIEGAAIAIEEAALLVQPSDGLTISRHAGSRLEGGEETTLVLEILAGSGASPGLRNVGITVLATDDNDGRDVSLDRGLLASFNVLRPAALQVEIPRNHHVFSTGNSGGATPLQLLLTNTGEARMRVTTARAVTPLPPEDLEIIPVPGAPSLPVELGGGESHAVILAALASPSLISFRGGLGYEVRASEMRTGRVLREDPGPFPLSIIAQAELVPSGGSLAVPASVNPGQRDIAISLESTNLGDSAAIIELASLAFDAPIDATLEVDRENTEVGAGDSAIWRWDLDLGRDVAVGTYPLTATLRWSDTLHMGTALHQFEVSAVLRVDQPGRLELVSTTLGDQAITPGDPSPVEVIVKIRNSGGATVDVSDARLLVTPSEGINVAPLVVGNITGDATEELRFAVTADAGASPGDRSLGVSVFATDVNDGANVSLTRSGIATIGVRRPAEVSAELLAARPTLTTGQQAAGVQLELFNGGEVDAEISALELDGDDALLSPRLVGAALPLPLAAGARVLLDLAVDAPAEGADSTLTARVTLTEAASARSFEVETQLFLPVVAPAELSVVAAAADPPGMIRGQAGGTLELTLRNDGGADAALGAVQLAPVDGVLFTRQDSIGSIGPGQSETLLFHIRVDRTAALGPREIAITVEAVDGNDPSQELAPVSAENIALEVQSRARPFLGSVGLEARVAVTGQRGISVFLPVQNRGTATLLVDAAGLLADGPGLTARRTDAVSSIAGLASTVLEFELDVAPDAFTGVYEIDAFFDGTDASSLDAASASSASETGDLLIRRRAALNITRVDAPDFAFPGETFLLELRISNSGDVAANYTGLRVESEPPIPGLTIAYAPDGSWGPFIQTTFLLVQLPAGAPLGDYQLHLRYDDVQDEIDTSGEVVTEGFEGLAQISVVEPAVLSLALATEADYVAADDRVVVELTLENTGSVEAQLDLVTLAADPGEAAGTWSIALETPPASVPATLAAGASTVLSYGLRIDSASVLYSTRHLLATVDFTDIFHSERQTARIALGARGPSLVETFAVDSSSEWRFGAALTGLGDTDGDGLDDFAAGAPGNLGESFGLMPRGYVRVVTQSTANGDVDHADAPYSGGLDSNYGHSLVAVSDIDGDGVRDLFVGAPSRKDSGTSDIGRVELLSGAPAALLWSFDGDAPEDCNLGLNVAAQWPPPTPMPSVPAGSEPPTAQLLAAHTITDGCGGLPRAHVYWWLGGVERALEFDGDISDIAVLGDQDADGVAELVVVEDRRIYVFSGQTGDQLAQVSAGVPEHVAAIPDLNGDGLADLLVGSPTTSEAFAVTTSGTEIHEWAESPESYGDVVAPAGDLDRDGVMDVAVGAPHAASASGSGGFWAYSGADGSSLFRLTRNGSGSEFGAALAPIGDFDGDGRDELAVGVPGNNEVFLFAYGLVSMPRTAALRSGMEVEVSADFGVPPYRYALTQNASGGTFDLESGVYVAGGSAGVDVLEVTDRAGDTARSTLSVSPELGESLDAPIPLTWRRTMTISFDAASLPTPESPGTDLYFDVKGCQGDGIVLYLCGADGILANLPSRGSGHTCIEPQCEREGCTNERSFSSSAGPPGPLILSIDHRSPGASERFTVHLSCF